jgi:hypothetical protein
MKLAVQAREHGQQSEAQNWRQQGLLKQHTPGIFAHGWIQKEFLDQVLFVGKFD